MVTAGIGDLKNNLSRYVRRVEAGERIAVTAHGRVVAVLAAPAREGATSSRLSVLIHAGIVRPPLESGDPLPDRPRARLTRGSAARLLEADRDGT